jgi:L-threonylcarbamoyladenylate synthase
MTARLHSAGQTIRQGGIIAYPTESFYALGADATNVSAIKKAFRMKGRGRKPIALIAADIKQVQRFFYLSPKENELVRKYWPGPVTVLLKPKTAIAARALSPTTPSRRTSRSGRPSLKKEGTGWSPRRTLRIGVRVPAHEQARALALYVGAPITATSANRTGRRPTKSASRVRARFPTVPLVPGACGRGTKPSTVIEVVPSSPNLSSLRGRRGVVVLRAGSVKV